MTNLRQAVRALLSTPATTALAVATMAGALGANTAVFTVVYATVLRALPFPEPDRVALVSSEFPRMQMKGLGVSGPEALEFAELTQAWKSSGIVRFDTATVAGRSEPVQTRTAYVTASLFDVLGTPAQIGRPFTPAEDVPGGPRVAVLGNGLWRRSFGADPAVVGSAVRIDGVTRTIVGVMPRGFDLLGQSADLWLPLALDRRTPGPRADHQYVLVARLADGRTLTQAQTDLTSAMSRWQQATGELHTPNPSFHPLALTPLIDATVGPLRQTMLLMLGAVGFVLLMACANVSNLLLGRAEARRHELAVRLALGAPQWRLLMDHVVEGLCLASAGAAAGLLLAAGALRLLLAQAVVLPRHDEIRLDPAVLLFTLGATAIAGIVFGLAPVLRLDGSRAFAWLKGDGRGTTLTRERQRLQRALIAVQVALALVLLTGAGIMLRGFWRLAHVDPGFNSTGVVSMQLSLPSALYESNEQVWTFYEQLLARLRAGEASNAAAMSGALPERRPNNSSFFLEGVAVFGHEGIPQVTFVQHVSPGFFETLGIRPTAGRLLTDDDRDTSMPVAVVNETLARKFWPNDSAIGKRLRAAMPGVPFFTVVGVVPDMKQGGLRAPAGADLFVTHRQARLLMTGWMPRDMTVIARTTPGRTSELARSMRAAVRELNPGLAIANLEPMSDGIERTIAQPRAVATLLASFAGAALLLAAIGIYGVISFAVQQRTPEFAVRIALGAAPASVIRLVFAQAALPVAGGVAVGIAGAVASARLLRSLVFDIRPADPPTIVGVVLFLTAIAMAACWVPARRATQVDPIEALKDV